VREVAVRLRGSSSRLRDAPLQDLRAYVDLAGEAPGERAYFLGPESVEAPSGVTVMRVDPSQTLLRLDRTVTGTVRVSPRVLGEPATGFEIYRVEIAPAEFSIEGPESLIRDLASVTTEPISAQGLRESYSRRLQIELDPALRPGVRQVDVELTIGEERESHDFEVAVRPTLAIEEADGRCTVELGTVVVTVRIPRSMVGRVTPEDLIAELSCAGLLPGENVVRPTLRFPMLPDAPIAAVAFDPEEIRVFLAGEGANGQTEPPPWEEGP